MPELSPQYHSAAEAVQLVAAAILGLALTVGLTSIVFRNRVNLDRHTVMAWVIVTYVLTLGAGWAMIGSPFAPQFASGADHFDYHLVIVQLTQTAQHFWQMDLWVDRIAFLQVMSTAQSVFGRSAYVTVTVNAVLSAATVLALADLAGKAARESLAAATAAAAVFLPGYVVWRAIPIREAMFVLTAIVAINCIVRLTYRDMPVRQRILTSAGLLASALAFTRLRAEGLILVGVACAVVAIASLAWYASRPTSLLNVATRIGAIAMVAAAAVTMVGRDFYRAASIRVNAMAEQFKMLSEGAGTGIALPFPSHLGPMEPWDFLVSMPTAVFRGLTGPLPILEPAPLFLTIDAVSSGVIASLAIVGIASQGSYRSWRMAIPTVPALAWIWVVGFSMGNWGIVSRMRVVALLLLLVPAVAGAEWLVHRSRTRGRSRDHKAYASTNHSVQAATGAVQSDQQHRGATHRHHRGRRLHR